MKTYFVQFKVVPTVDNEHFYLAEGALAACWIVEHDLHAAYAKAAFYVSKYDWKIVEVETSPVEVTKEHFIDRDIGLEQYNKAQEEGLSVFYVAWAKDKKTTIGPIAIRPSYRPDISLIIKKQKQANMNGRCLHYDSGKGCGQIIHAHSIQKKQSLSSISREGHIYKPSTNMSTLKKNKGKPAYEKCGINNVSTFLGFCKKHDNELFESIDNLPLSPTDHQVSLYAYRSLCRELFVKENVLDLLEDRLNSIKDQNVIKDLLYSFKIGTEFGLTNLKEHKSRYDESLKRKTYSDIRYALFISKQKPTITFSGLFYPDFDFMGRHLQNLGDRKNRLELITICSSPMLSGWGFLFSWHHTSAMVCTEFMRSLSTMIHDGYDIGDLLFRMVISNCENHAISPEWWESLPENHRKQITERVSLMANSFSMTQPTYLYKGLEGIAHWHFDSVISNM